ncbi:protein spire homolog 1-like isoform X2 [Oratosquilla oratoria]|uniref:protein spire homolog 1-like isoform X2 n=1 Tax=Oratosquilla oratoria TaxID=337810 RepID=UPI003F773660
MSLGTPKECALDPNGCICLEKILASFSTPISEEQAWALCYNFVKCFNQLSAEEKSRAVTVARLKHVQLHKDGYLHESTFLPTGDTEEKKREPATSEGKLVAEFGVTLYRALDFTLADNEERDLSPTLYKLIDVMTSAGLSSRAFRRRRSCKAKRKECERVETDDEGIERDSGDSEDEFDRTSNFTLDDALQICENRLENLGKGVNANDHYRAVVRALVAEALELSFFLKTMSFKQKLTSRQQDLVSSEHDLYKLHCDDWARLWMQTMRELREGVKLKKVQYTRTPIEYALTPYEMLMEDIRSRRYSLNKVMVNGDIPHRVKKDAHAIILDFIRSRPPLKKASERKLLPPPRKVSSPMELLMESITKQEHRLRPIATPDRARPMSSMHSISDTQACTEQPRKPNIRTLSVVETSRSGMLVLEKDSTPPPRRKLIKAPVQNLLNFSTDDDDDDDLSDIPPSSPRLPQHKFCPNANASPSKGSPEKNGTAAGGAVGGHTEFVETSSGIKSPVASPVSRMAYDLATYGSNSTPERRHSITVCESPLRPSSKPPSAVCSPSQSPSKQSPTNSSPPDSPTYRHFVASASQTQRDFLSSSHFSSRLDCLSLTLEEVVHIRNVLTKADLESLPLDLTIKEDMAKGKVCFLCMKTRFSFFGPRGQECRLCKRLVCKKCVSKMRIPTEHFSNIPVFALTPHALSPRDDDEDGSVSLPRAFLSRLQSSLPGSVLKKVQVKKHQRQKSLKWIKSILDYQEFSMPSTSGGGGGGSGSSSSDRRSSLSGSVGSAPSSPTPGRSDGPMSLPVQPPAPMVNEAIRKRKLVRARTIARFRDIPWQYDLYLQKQLARSKTNRDEDRIRGELMCVCGDCKAMVLHIILSIKTRRDHVGMTNGSGAGSTGSTSSSQQENARLNLHLNLTPVYQ